MNYYEHHLGDYAAATAHLSWDEDMAYTRLLRAYYHSERGIPQAEAYRLARATTAAQRKAVDVVLAEFFTLADGAHHQKRADEEIARLQEKRRKASASANARWSQCERNANASDTDAMPASERIAKAMRTHSEGNARAPVPSLQTPDTSSSLRSEGETRKRAPPCPDDVDAQVWSDWLALRKQKRANVTATVLDGARSEAAKAGMPLEAFLRVWCRRGSQGLEAAWLKPEERNVVPLDRKARQLTTAGLMTGVRQTIEVIDAEPRAIAAS